MINPFNNFLPFDEPDADYYSFEVSDLDVYNFEIFTNEASARLRGGQNDVLEIVGQGAGAFGVGFPDRIGFDRVVMSGTVGVRTKGGEPVLTGINPGTTFAGFGIDAVSDDIDSAFVGAKPFADGTRTFGMDENGQFPMTIFYPDVFDVELVVDRYTFPINGMPMEKTTVKSRPAGSDTVFDIIIDALSSVPTNPFPDGLFGSFVVAELDEGGIMFLDDIITVNLRDPAGVPVTNLIIDAFDAEIDAFIELSMRPVAARQLIQSAIDKITQAENTISAGSFQSGTLSADALIELMKAKDLDQQALRAIANGDTDKAGQLLIGATTAKARVELFMEGHNPQPGPFPDGLGGFDDDDPDFIFADGFESGDVSAWSTGDPVDVSAPTGACQADQNTLCLPQDERFKVEPEWKDFLGNSGPGLVKERFDDSGVFSFFDPNNADLTVQLLDGCDIDSHFWVFAAGLTDVEFTLTVTDTMTSKTKTYFNALGHTPEIRDTEAFATCP